MNIVVDGRIFEMQRIGGISRIFKETLPRMCRFNNSLRITLLTGGPLLQPLPQHPQIQHQPLTYWEKMLRPGRNFRQVRWRGRNRSLSGWLEENQADVWHSTYYTIPLQWRYPTVVTVYDLIYEHYPQMFSTRQDERTRSKKQEAILAADAVICISETTRADLEGYFDVDPAKLHVIPLAASSVFREIDSFDSAKNGDRSFLLYIGNRKGYKNFATLLEAYKRWPLRSDIDLLVADKPWTKIEIQQLQDLGLSNNVRLETDVSDQRLVSLYNQAVAFIYPSLYEGFGLPLLEAMACGCPIVASEIPSNVEVAGEAAAYFDPESLDSLLDALDKVVINGRSASAVQHGKKVAAAYSWDKTAHQTLDVYYGLA